MPVRLPQIRDFGKLRHLLRLIASGRRDASDIGQRMGAGDKHAARHAGYYREAADILGLVEVRRWVLTARGRGLLSTEAGSEEEKAVLRGAVADAEDLGKLRHSVLAEDEPDVEALIEWALEALDRGSRSTVQRRIKDTLSWRQYLGVASAPRPRRHFLRPERSGAQLDLLTRAPTIEPGEWPKAELLPFNWPQDRISVQRTTYPDLQASDEVLLVMGYASLQHLCEFVSSLEEDLPKSVRVVFGHEPFVGGDRPPRDERGTLSQDMRDFWLEQGISIIHAKAVLETIAALESERLRSRISRRSQGLHAKMFIGQDAITVGSSNFTEPGLNRQLEANVRLRDDRKTGPHLREARKLGEIYWKLSVPFDDELRALLEQLLRRVTWQEALARACAELLEGEWARGYLTDELGYGGRLWPSQVQGIGQALRPDGGGVGARGRCDRLGQDEDRRMAASCAAAAVGLHGSADLRSHTGEPACGQRGLGGRAARGRYSGPDTQPRCAEQRPGRVPREGQERRGLFAAVGPRRGPQLHQRVESNSDRDDEPRRPRGAVHRDADQP